MRSPRLFLSVALVAVALVPAMAWAWSAGPEALTWRGLASLTGYGAAGLFAVSMLLMLRLTWLARAFGGLASLQRAHHALGTAAFLVLLLHPLSLAAGALQMHPLGTLRLLWPLSSGLVFLGWAALLLFVVFFLFTTLPELPFDRWRRVHQASGLAYAAMAGHLVAAWTGSLADSLGLGLVGAGALGYATRLFVQDVPRAGLRYRVTEVHHRAPDIVDLTLQPLGRPLRFDAGQFVYLAVTDAPGYRPCGEFHPYTMVGHPADPQLHLTIKALGDCTRRIQEITAGAEVRIQGPFGGLFPAGPLRRSQVWIAGGMGIAPFWSRLLVTEPDEPPIDIIYAAANERAAVYLDSLRALARQRPNVRLHTSFDDSVGLLTAAAIRSRVGDLDGRAFVLAGPPAMVTALKRQLRDLGVPASRIHSEEGVSPSRARPVVLASTLAFFLSSAALAVLAWRALPESAPSPTALQTFTAAEVAQHDQPDDCWLVIRGKVYDVSRYIGSHPTAPQVITVHCGTDSTVAFETKDHGRPHSPQAWKELEDYLIGRIDPSEEHGE